MFFFTGNPYSIYYFHLLFRPFHLPNYRWFALLPPRIDSIRLDSLVHFHFDRNVTNSRPVWSLYVLIYQSKRKFAYFLPHDFQSFIQFFRNMFFFWQTGRTKWMSAASLAKYANWINIFGDGLSAVYWRLAEKTPTEANPPMIDIFFFRLGADLWEIIN